MATTEHWSSILANIVTALGILSFIGLYLAHRQTQSQFRFTVMLSCIDRFQQLVPIIRNDENDTTRLKKYIDLTNEEFFYFQRNYIPKEVMIEWMDTIVEYLPIYTRNSSAPINYSTWIVKLIHDENLVKGYPRLLHALTIGAADIDVRDKERLIRLISKNLGVDVRSGDFRQAFTSSYKNMPQ